MPTVIDQLVINSPYEEPSRHWRYDRDRLEFKREESRRPSGYMVATKAATTDEDPGDFVKLPLVNRIRKRVGEWRAAGWPGATGVTRRLLEHWWDRNERETRQFFFCQLEAAETLIWLTEAPVAERVGIEIPSDGGNFQRLCAKMATGSGKTVVMAMVIAWQVLNKTAYPRDTRFSRDVLVIAPGLTVKRRLAVLAPSNPANYYREFNVVPSALHDKLRRGRVEVCNWHTLNWETDQQLARKRSVDKRGAKSDAAYAREVLKDMANARNLLVINDEAHHAWRTNPGAAAKGTTKAERDQATKWIGGLDRIARTRGILNCYDFSATPIAPTGGASSAGALFGWIVSDFGLNDAIEAGLVKTPRVVVHDDALPDTRTFKSRLYHIYNDREVKADLNRRAPAEEPLPDLVLNGYYLLGFDWKETAQAWAEAGAETPPVMITVANRTETAARVKHAFDAKRVLIDELCDTERTLHIDSKVLEKAEAAASSGEWLVAGEDSGKAKTKPQQAEWLRQQVDSVGQVGKPGAQIQNVISVGMLSEGWDAKTVTHIMGLRAFTSQLLCEQVVGRGLRRTSYEVDPETGLFEPEFVNVFGVPFAFLPHQGAGVVVPPPTKPKTPVEPRADRSAFEIGWPSVVRIDHVFRPRLTLDLSRVEPLQLNASQTASLAELAPLVDGEPDVAQVRAIDLERLARESRTQRIVFQTAADVYKQMQPDWKGGDAVLLGEVVRLVEAFIRSDRIRILPAMFEQDDLRRRLMITLNMTRVVQHIWEAIRFENTQRLELVLDQDQPVRSTGDMATWYTGRPCTPTTHSHINVCVHDGSWEAAEAFELDRNPVVSAWVKNDHLGFDVLYIHNGVVRKYRPDFIIRLDSGVHLVLEVKGRDSAENQTKRRFLDEWVNAVNAHGGFGRWACDVSFDPGDIKDVLARHSQGKAA